MDVRQRFDELQSQVDALTLELSTAPDAASRLAIRRRLAPVTGELVAFRSRHWLKGVDLPRPVVGPAVGENNPDYEDHEGAADE